MNQQERRRLFDDQSRYVDRFGLLLVVTSLAVVVLSLVDLRPTTDSLRSDVGQVAVSVFVGATLLLALRASGVGRRLRIVSDIVVSVGVLAAVVVVFLDQASDATAGSNLGTPSVIWVLLSVLAPVLVVRRLIHHKRASGKTLLAAVSAYLLIALAFNFAYLFVDTLSTGPFFGDPQPTSSFMYYSLVTVTTLGFGDLAAVDPVARLLTTIEAVVGQVYLVTIVAMIVGLMVSQRERTRAGD